MKSNKTKLSRALYVTLCLCLLIGMALPLYACKKEPAEVAPPAGVYTRMTVDINPSIELMVDDQGKVASVTALNDDGSILISGEVFVGKTPEEATQLILQLATDTGYLVKGEIKAESTEGSQTVSVSVSGDSEYAKQLCNKVQENAKQFLADNGIVGKVELLKAKTLEELRAIAVQDGLFTEAEVQAFNEEQLYRALAAGRIETAELLTQELRDAYYQAKAYQISFVEKQATANAIAGINEIYKLMMTEYRTALENYSKAVTALDEKRYELLVSPDSAYQKALQQLRDAKAELLKEKKLLASVKVDDENYTEISASFQMSEETYERLLKAVENAGTAANTAMEAAITALRGYEVVLKNLETTLFSTEEIQTVLTEKATEIEANVNAAKDAFFESFEAAHKDDITAIEEALRQKKQQLITEAKGEAA